MRSDRATIINGLFAAPLCSGKRLRAVIRVAQPKFSWDDFFREIALADEQGHDEHTRLVNATQNGANGRLQFPETLDHLRAEAIKSLIGRGFQRQFLLENLVRSEMARLFDSGVEM